MLKLIPNPGSKEALDLNCKCPIIDNEHGRGYHWTPDKKVPMFIVNSKCSLHEKFFNVGEQ